MMSEIDDLKTMFKSGNDVPVTRVTITLEQFERICEMFKNQHDSGLAVIKENQQLRFDNTELVQERDRLRESEKYEGQLFKIATQDGYKFVPGVAIEQCSGLAVTMCGVGRFTITHISSGSRVCNGNYERCDKAIHDMSRLAAIAHAHGFSWEEESPQDRIKEIADKPVPFDGCTITDKDGTRPMPIGRFIQSLRPCVPFRDIDSPPWEDERPIDEAERILSAMNGDKES
jgi:PAS domain-containing protein